MNSCGTVDRVLLLVGQGKIRRAHIVNIGYLMPGLLLLHAILLIIIYVDEAHFARWRAHRECLRHVIIGSVLQHANDRRALVHNTVDHLVDSSH